MAHVDIKKFSPTSMKPNTIILLVGKRGTGKSTLLEDLCYYIRDKVDFAVGMSPTEDTNQALGQFIPKSTIYGEYDEEVVVRIMDMQKNMWRAGRGYSCLLILDDCCYDKKILRSKVIREIFMNGRHRRMTLILSAQYVMDLPPDLRTQVDYVFALRENVVANREKLFKQFFGFFNSFADFAKTMDSCTENFECMVCDNKTAKGNSIDDSVRWYKASLDLPRFKVGKPFLWGMHRKYYKKQQFQLPKFRMGNAGAGGAMQLAGAAKGRRTDSKITIVIKKDENGNDLVEMS